MQYSFVTLATLIAAVAAQNGGVPACASSCVTLLPPSCPPQDIGCICGDASFISNVSCCVSQKCSGSDQAAALDFARSICQAGGVSLTVTGATCIGSSTSAPASSSSSAAASTTVVNTVSTTASGAPTGSANSTVTTGTPTGSGGASNTPTGPSGSTSLSSGMAAKATAVAGFVGAAAAALAFL